MNLEDYALIGDCHTAALVGRDGGIDWLCFPRFDSAACFAALLGNGEHGRWSLAPASGAKATSRRYREGTLVLETSYEDAAGAATVIDFMPPRTRAADLVRIVAGRSGSVAMRSELIARFDYGSTVPWARRGGDAVSIMAGPDVLRLRSPVAAEGDGRRLESRFTVRAGEVVAFDLTWHPSHEEPPPGIDPSRALDETTEWWRAWSSRSTYDGEWRDAVNRSLITLKALTYQPTGGLVAAPTTSLPEHLGGVRNWDYRYCWLRDATFTLYALLESGYVEEACAWREWLLRACAGLPSQVHVMYGVRGERRLPELELPWLPGYEGSRPVRIGNDAHRQLQLDVFGEVLDTLYHCWRAGLSSAGEGWRLEHALLEFLESAWRVTDTGIWEVRGPPRHFTHSKVMAWVAFDRAVRGCERFGLEGPVDRWRALRDEIHAQVCREGYSGTRGTFVQSYGSDALDASLLTIPLVGFLPATDERVRRTIEAIERELVTEGFVSRYVTDPEVDGLPRGEASFLLCTFWLADCLGLIGRREDALRTFERLLAVRSDLGLLSESYDVAKRRLVGNYPQAFSHIGLVNTARNLSRRGGPAEDRPH